LVLGKIEVPPRPFLGVVNRAVLSAAALWAKKSRPFFEFQEQIQSLLRRIKLNAMDMPRIGLAQRLGEQRLLVHRASS